MPATPAPYAVIFGGWYQRTTLHLTEIYDFFSFRHSHPELDQTRLQSLHSQLSLTGVTREAGYLEYVQAKTKEGILIRYYEDGLYVLELGSSDVKSAQTRLQDYYQSTFEPAISYIYIFIAAPSKDKVPVFDLMEMQIFFREFKDQLAKYLDIHRRIWEDIGDIKERRVITGREIGPLRARLDAYQKTVSLIGNRINQMGAYVNTRSSIARDMGVDNHLKTLFQYKFEVLENSLSYIKEIWSMTREYLTSAIGVLREQETQATTNSIKSLSIITSIGVVSGLVVHLTRKDVPFLTLPGLAFLGLLILITALLNVVINRYYKNLKYRLKFTDSASDI